MVLELAAAAFSAALWGPCALGVGCWPMAPLPREKPEPLLLLFFGITCGIETASDARGISAEEDFPAARVQRQPCSRCRPIGCTIGSAAVMCGVVNSFREGGNDTECGSEGVAGGQQCEGSTHADCPENASSVKVLRTMGCTIGSVSFARSCAGFAPP